MTRRFIRGAAGTLILAGGSLLFFGCNESQALESELNAANGGQPLVQHPVDLSGTWKLNPDASDNPRDVLGNRRGQGPHAGARSDSGARGFRRPGRPEGRHGGGPGDRVLTITQTDETVTLTHGPGRSISFTPNGQAVTKEGRGGERRVTARWEGEVLVVEHSGPRGGSMTRSFQLSADGQQLIVTTRFAGGPSAETVEFRTVFDKS